MEVMVSIAVLTVGLIGMAAMVCSTLVFGTNAKYMNMANVLTSEKLDNLNKWPSNDPNVAPGGGLVGPKACAAGDTYCDQITVSQVTGANYITQSQIVFDPVKNTSTLVTTTIVHTSGGCVDTPVNCGVPAPNNGGATFIRRWRVTADPVITSSTGAPKAVTGGRRVTVLVSLVNNISKQPVSFQMSMVRP